MQNLISSFTGPNATLDLTFAASARSKAVADGEQALPVFTAGDDVSGELKITVFGGKRVDHAGIRVELRGVVELSADRSVHEIMSLSRDVAPPGQLSGLQALKWSFPKAPLKHETYTGINARVRYYVRAIVLKQGYSGGPVPSSSLTRDADFRVINISEAQPQPTGQADGASPEDSSVKLEVGIEDCLHIEFQYDRTRLGLTDVVSGHVDFLLVRIRIKHAELALIRRESAGITGSANVVNDNETVSRFEIMDGAPVKGERIPLRMSLAGLDVGPSLTAVAGVLSVRYFLNLVLVDEEDRRYFKQCEVTLDRKKV